MGKLIAELLLERETKVTFGRVPTHLHGKPLEQMSWQMQQGEFLLRAEGDYFFYIGWAKGSWCIAAPMPTPARNRCG